MKKIFIFVISIFVASQIQGKTILDITEKDYIIGDINAPVTIIEYVPI